MGMHRLSICKTKEEQSALQECPGEQCTPAPSRVGIDSLDALPLRCLPGELPTGAREILTEAVTALASEGARGPAAKRLLSRDIQLARVQLRQVEALRSLTLKQYINGSGSERRVRLLERLVENQHRRLLASLDALARLDPAPIGVRITAAQAAVHIDQTGSK